MKQKILKILVCLETVIIVLLVIWVVFQLKISETKELLRETSPSGDYTIVINEKGEPDWPFGADHIEVILFENTNADGYEASFEADVSNDGARAGYKVDWMDDGVQIALSGEEQPTAYYFLPFKTFENK